ncbi:MAG: pyridoxal-phosphate dependent enzyme [Alphaproteobacteria bacterium]|nr:pyridoxal-phosphate dependent enzyme [Alphaproteobacteria bacterium]
MIGNTPMVRVNRLDTGKCTLFLKLENQNPGGSVKDRIGLSMIEAAEKDGTLKPGGTIIEATAGNTGLGLALVATQKGYRIILVIPDKMSQDKIFHLKAMGADVIMTRSDVGKGHPEYYQDMAERMANEMPGAFYANQFGNPANPRAHETATGPEIWQQMDHDVDVVVCGVGSGGTITGLGRYFKKVQPKLKMVLADPKGSILADAVNIGKPGDEVGSWLVEGIGEDFVPPVCDLDLVAEAITVSDAESFAAVRDLLAHEGILGGTSTGTLVAAALKYCRKQTDSQRVVTFVADTGNKYLAKAYNDAWLIDHGLLKRDSYDDLRDLIPHRSDLGDIVSVSREDTLLTAYERMRMFDVSQLPVMDEDKIVGIVAESDLLLAVYRDEDSFGGPVEDIMETRLETVSHTDSLQSLLPVFRADKVAIVVGGDDTFYGLITQVDFINHLRMRLSSR